VINFLLAHDLRESLHGTGDGLGAEPLRQEFVQQLFVGADLLFVHEECFYCLPLRGGVSELAGNE
jgi:hypothetical protein